MKSGMCGCFGSDDVLETKPSAAKNTGVLTTEPKKTRPAPTESTPTEVASAGPAPVDPAPTRANLAESTASEPVHTDPAPKEPVPAESEPLESAPPEPESVESVPGEPESVESVPGEPESVESVPGEPKPVDSETVESAPIEPEPVESVPTEPEPAESVPVEQDPTESTVADVSTEPVTPASDASTAPTDSLGDPTPEIRERCEELQLSDEQLREIMKRLLENIERGLRRDTHDSSIVKCFVTYVQDLPNGSERGRFMALDLGGTNFRVLLIELGDNNHFDMKSKIFAIPEYIMIGPGKQLFDHIADCLATFMREHHLENECLPLGFTFSFPCTQAGLTKGLLVRWTKGFNCSGVIGNDVVELLQEAIAKRQDIKIDVMAILNDTTGTLMSCAWKKHDCRIGLIVGTGSNACYVEKIENAELFDGDRSKPHVLINTEWGAFGDDGALDFVRTEYDRDIDENSINAGTQLHEKMISGMYMGELVRLVLVKMTNDKLLFNGQGSDLLFKRGNFFTKYVSEIESDKKGTYTSCRQVLEELGLGHATDQDCANVRYVCQVVSQRAAHLASAGMAVLINKIKEDKITVGIDGSVYRYHPHFHNLMMEKIAALVDPGRKFDIMLSEDGSGRGAALVAAVASREGHQKSV